MSTIVRTEKAAWLRVGPKHAGRLFWTWCASKRAEVFEQGHLTLALLSSELPKLKNFCILRDVWNYRTELPSTNHNKLPQSIHELKRCGIFS